LSDASTGEAIYRAACVTCHGPDGKGSPRSTVGFDTPLPDFTDCAFATAEADVDWHAVVHEGGRIRGLNRRMPAFGDALTAAQIDAVVGYLRHFCGNDAWPHGDLNFPRDFTEKAFPENEVVHTNSITRGDAAAVGNEVVYERRFGARKLDGGRRPGRRRPAKEWLDRRPGDVALAFRRTFVANLQTGTDRRCRRGSRVPDGRCGSRPRQRVPRVRAVRHARQALPHNALQVHGESRSLGCQPGREGSVLAHGDRLHPHGRPRVRLPGRPSSKCCWLASSGGDAEWDVVPQLQVSLSKIQHVVVAGGVRIPVNARASGARPS
jgi:hypothetical protein